MRLLHFLSEFTIPLIIFYIVGYGLLQKKNVYESFISGAREGMEIVVRILPTLTGLMVGTGVLRASGLLDFLGDHLGMLLERVQVPGALVPLIILRMFSSSAATGLCLDIFQQYGPDSQIGMITSIMMGCTETIFYTMSVYFMTAKVKNTRYTLPGALAATFAGIAASIFLAGKMTG
ncbi:spore maturation protein [Oscillospiraceae bacterium Marseille-Q3528]|nr:spore maturation protein [Oscillospiraceae bacterium Marseille-Q3528]